MPCTEGSFLATLERVNRSPVAILGLATPAVSRRRPYTHHRRNFTHVFPTTANTGKHAICPEHHERGRQFRLLEERNSKRDFSVNGQRYRQIFE